MPSGMSSLRGRLQTGQQVGALHQNPPVALHRASPLLCLAMGATGSAELWQHCPALVCKALPGWRQLWQLLLPSQQIFLCLKDFIWPWAHRAVRLFLPPAGQSLSADAEPCSRYILGAGMLSCSPSTHCWCQPQHCSSAQMATLQFQCSSEDNVLHAGTSSGVPPSLFPCCRMYGGPEGPTAAGGCQNILFTCSATTEPKQCQNTKAALAGCSP